MYSIKQIAGVLQGKAIIQQPETAIEHLLTDSRRLVFAPTTLFFALKTQRNNGVLYVDELYQRGVRNFVLHQPLPQVYAGANFILVDDTLQALQHLAAWHRQHFNLQVIGITGSNGKTMVKEWLFQLLQNSYQIVRSPKSYNSQVGVPLSVWQINGKHTLAIFEAGISQPGEMQNLTNIIQPTLGILTNIGEAHSEGFTNTIEKVKEKLLLFKQASSLIYCKDCDEQLGSTVINDFTLSVKALQAFSWGTLAPADLSIQQTQTTNGFTTIKALITATGKAAHITIPFTDKASIDNAITCWCVLLQLGFEDSVIETKMRDLLPLDMRMQLKKGINNCLLINDSYNNDLSSLELALDYLSQQGGGKKTTLILSDIFQSGHAIGELMSLVGNKVKNRHVDRLILIGPLFFANQPQLLPQGQPAENGFISEFYPSTEVFLQEANTHHFSNEVILLKGSRVFAFERIVHWLEEKVHQTVMEINLTAMVHNLKEYQRLLSPKTKVMAMVKAFSYGSGSAEIATVLQFHKVDYLAVAYADEGVELRKAGIHMPIMVMSPEQVTFDALVEHNLEPELYSPNMLQAFSVYLSNLGIPQYPVHIKLDTGMHRLGFEADKIEELLKLIKRENPLAIQSVFSHLVASENNEHDDFTTRQAQMFEDCCNKIEEATGYPFLKHLSNSAAIFRHPHLQYNMVRLGIGLYGVDGLAKHHLPLQNVATLKSTIAQIRQVKAGDSVGYSRKGILSTDSLIATIRLGYADGFSRNLGNGAGCVFVKGKLAPVVGNVCMDMTMIDITHIPGVNEGDEVEIFGPNLPVEKVAAWGDTITYEILTGISQRVKRVYYEE